MFTTSTQLKGLVIQATDGELGTVDQLNFDDETWAIRYLTVDTGGWLGGRHVLISPMSIAHADWPAHYGRPPYWLRETGHKSALSLSGV